MTTNTMTRNEIIDELATAALDNFEFSCEWAKAADAAKEAAQDLGIRLERGLILHSVNVAKLRWNAIIIRTKNEIDK